MAFELETVYAALFSTVASGTTAAAASIGRRLITSRRTRHWSEVTPDEMPILMMGQKHQQADVKVRGAPTVWSLFAEFIIYVSETDPKSAPAILLNPLVDAVRASLKPLLPPAGNGMHNLGLPEMVEHAAIEGMIDTDEGLLGDLAYASIPVRVLCKPAY